MLAETKSTHSLTGLSLYQSKDTNSPATRKAYEMSSAPVPLQMNERAISHLIPLLLSPSLFVRKQAVWVLGDAARSCRQMRDMIVNSQALPLILETLSSPDSNLHLLRCAAWALSNLMMHKPAPPLSVSRMAFPVLRELASHPDIQVRCAVMWSLSYISDGDTEHVQTIIDANVLETIAGHLAEEHPTTVTPILRIVANFARGNTEQVRALLDLEVLERLETILRGRWKWMCKVGGQTLSVLMVGDALIFSRIISKGSIIPALAELACQANGPAQEDALCALRHAACRAGQEDSAALIRQGALGAFCTCLVASNTRLTTMALEGIVCFLDFDDKGMAGSDEIDSVLHAHDAAHSIARLLEHPDDTLRDAALAIADGTGFGIEVGVLCVQPC